MSQFLRNTDSCTPGAEFGIEFDDAVKLTGGGSTCDIYRTRRQRRDVFVKRLKDEYRFNPLYLDALDKEFDVGVNLKHPSLPEYREFHRDYIIMDYIDGSTLADMIVTRDSYLASEKNIVSMLRELVDVVGYLHRRNVIHCDIKADNIMITANTRNLVLIDFDKSYTDSLGDTSGHPAKYGLTVEEKGRTAIDFRGIGMVVERLKAEVPGFKFSRYNKFVKACFRPDVDSEQLAAILDYNPGRSRRTAGIVIGLAAIFALLTLAVVYLNRNEVKEDLVAREVERTEKGLPDTAAIPAPVPVAEAVEAEIPVARPLVENDIRKEVVADSPDEPVDSQQTPLNILDESVKPCFDKMIAGLDELDKLRADKSLTAERLTDGWIKYQQLESNSMNEMANIVSDLSEQYPDIDYKSLINSTKSCTAYLRRANFVKSKYMDEIDRRSKSK